MDIVPALRSRLPKLRGIFSGHVLLAPHSWFRTGGPAAAFFEPEDECDLAYFLAGLDPEVPVLVLGAGSNLLVRDAGFEGIVIRLGKAFQTLDIEGGQMRAGAALPDVKLASAAAQEGFAGFSFFRGIPGSVGGALRMNAGAYGAETKNVLVSCRGFDRRGNPVEFSNAAMGFSYRHCTAPDDIIFTEARFAGAPADRERILAEMAEISKARAESQPVNTRTGGSTFKNPPGHKAWELIDQAGCRGLVVGDAQVSTLHCNFLINRGKATAADLENLGELVRSRVWETSGVRLEWEILRVGIPL